MPTQDPRAQGAPFPGRRGLDEVPRPRLIALRDRYRRLLVEPDPNGPPPAYCAALVAEADLALGRPDAAPPAAA